MRSQGRRCRNSLALTGVVPAACDAEAGELHEISVDRTQVESQRPSSPHWIHQETPPVSDHDVITVSSPVEALRPDIHPPQEART
jgi:hypothetical protein